MKTTVLLLPIVLLFAACTAEKGEHHSDAHWDYIGPADATHWADLDPDFIQCAEGKAQSPVDIRTSACKEADQVTSIQFHYRPSVLDIVNNGHTIQADYQQASFIQCGEKFFDLVQFHFHSPSEHSVDGKKFPMEMHLVHRDINDELAVIGVFIQEGAENPAFQPIWEHLPDHAAEHFQLNLQVDVQDLLPTDRSTYRYEGSLTTPPCSEGVHWFIMKSPISMSAAQLQKFQQLFKGNCRPIQPANGREVISALK